MKSHPADPLRSAIPPGEPERSRRLAILEGGVASAHGALVNGSILTALALGLGASDFHIGLIAGFSTIAHIGLLIGASGSMRIRSRKGIVVPAALTSRFLWVFLAAVPFLPVAPAIRIRLFLGVVLTSQVLFQMAVSPWSDWIADLVPEPIRGRYFGRRNALCGAVGMLSALAVGRSFDWLKSRAPEGAELRVFVPYFCAAALLACISAVLTRRQWDPPMRSIDRISIRDRFFLPLYHASFRTLIRFHVLWAIACSIAGPFFGAHMLRNLHMPMSGIAWYGILAGSVGLISQPLWGRIADRYGNRPVLTFNLVAVVTLPLLWLFATPDFLTPIWIDALLTGLCWPGFNLALFNLVLGTAPAENRQSFLATQGVLVGFAHFASAAAGGLLAQAWTGFSMHIGPLFLLNFHLLFVLSAVARLSLLPLAMGLHEPKASPIRVLISGVVEARYRLGDIILSGMEQTVAILRRRDRDKD